DVAVGTLMAGRNRAETEGLIGFFVNTVVLRTDMGGNPSFRELLGRVKEVALGAYAHPDLPFEKLVEELQPERDLSRNPLVQVTFQFFNPATQTSAPAEQQIELDRGVATFDLSLDMWETEGALQGRMEYSTDLFEASTVRRMLGHFERLLRGIAENPDEHIDSLPLMSGAEVHQQVTEWNQTGRAYPRGICIHDLVQTQAARVPDALAVIHGDEKLTYRQLNTRANQMAHHLRARGVTPDSVIGICGERSVQVITALLAVAKSGGAYVPLDPACPPERLETMVNDAQVRFIICGRRSTPKFASGKTIFLTFDDVTGSRGENPPADVRPRNLAYILYTSGSTGRPKGVMIEHESLVNHALACVERYGITPTDKVLQFASISFDVAAEEIFPAWAAGACVVLSSNAVPPPKQLAEQVAAEGITVLNLPTPYWHEWVDTLETGSQIPQSLRLLIIGSDRADEERLARWLAIAGRRVRLMNAYGATEATITSLAFDIPGDAWNPRRPLPIGRPLANVTAYIFDRRMRPVPIGVTGDLYLGGRGIARGYLNHDQASFMSSPFGDGRLYKTGDRARYLPDGNIVFAGRSDNQIKVRGFRVEPAEVESALKQFSGVRDAAVVLQSGSRLIAYVTAEQPIDPPEVLSFLKTRLPEYMLPAAIIEVDRLPFASNGKLDLNKLPLLRNNQSAMSRVHIKPATDMERLVAGIWQEALGLERVGTDDNFFDLGGHSLLMLRIHSKLGAALHQEISIVDLFRYPTIRSLVRFVSGVEPPAKFAASAASRARMQQQALQRRKVDQL
ncbi:MAG: non-ribosomal peptide synthetase, partial [Terriglobia bacterium]